MKRTILPAIVAMMVAASLVGATVASAGRIRASISLNSGSAATAAPTFGSQVTFNVSAASAKPSDLNSLWVKNSCTQNGAVVYAEYEPVSNGQAGPFTLGPTPAWTGGSANCTAYVWVFPNSETPLAGATVSYSVLP